MTKERAQGLLLGAISAHVATAAEALNARRMLINAAERMIFPCVEAVQHRDEIDKALRTVAAVHTVLKADCERM